MSRRHDVSNLKKVQRVGHEMKMRTRASAIVVVLALVLAACGNSKSSGGSGAASGSDRPGVTDTEIKVGGVASITNPLNGPYGDSFEGAQAYFDIVNKQGGVHGRQIKLVS